MIPYLAADHLWQSTIFALAACIVAHVFRGHQAQVRFAVWLAALVKFLVPFNWLTHLGRHYEWRSAPFSVPATAQELARPFTVPLSAESSLSDSVSQAVSTPSIAWFGLAVWLLGIMVVLGRWLSEWIRLWRAVRRSSIYSSTSQLPIPVRLCPAGIEPGLFGILRPSILLPEGLLQRLSPAEIGALLAHEICHWRRRDNLTALPAMLAQALFWFHPLVWWIGGRLLAEREQACDEAVLLEGNRPEVYASGIVGVCRHLVEPALPCSAGAVGGDLKSRLRAILSPPPSVELRAKHKALLAAYLAAAMLAPVLSGVRMQAAEETGPRFEVAAIRPNQEINPVFRLRQAPGGRVVSGGLTVANYIAFAYDLQDFQVVGGPGWIHSDRFDLQGKLTGVSLPATNAEFRQAFQPLLRERFALRFHEEDREGAVYFLEVEKAPKFKAHSGGSEGPSAAVGRGMFHGTRVPIGALASQLSHQLKRPVLDRTGLKGVFDIDLEWSPDMEGTDTSGKPGLVTAIREQLGLRLRSGRGPVRHVVVDSVTRPTEN